MPSDSYVFDLDYLSNRAAQLRVMQSTLDTLAEQAVSIISAVPSEAGVSAGGISSTLGNAADGYVKAAEDLRSRATYIWMAERSGNPVFLAMAMLPAPPHFSPGAMEAAGIGVAKGSSLAAKAAAAHLGQADVLLEEATKLVLHAASNTSTDKLIVSKMAEFVGDADKMRALSVHNAQLAAKLKIASHALTAAGSLLQFYDSYKNSAAQTTEGKILSGGLGAAFTYHPAFAAADLVTGGGVAGSADMYAVATEEFADAVAHRDSALLFGAGTNQWNNDNLSGDNGWVMQNYALAGEAISAPAGNVLDQIHPGFPFDGDGSINWRPSNETVSGWKDSASGWFS